MFMDIYEVISGGVVGGLVSYFVSKYNLKTSDVSSRLDEICEGIKELEATASSYWQSDGDQESLRRQERQIKGQFARISNRISRLSEKYWVVSGYADDDLIALRKIVMLSGFEELNRAADPSRIEQIQSACIKLEDSLRRAQTSIF
jgi:hypothetical protein